MTLTFQNIQSTKEKCLYGTGVSNIIVISFVQGNQVQHLLSLWEKMLLLSTILIGVTTQHKISIGLPWLKGNMKKFFSLKRTMKDHALKGQKFLSSLIDFSFLTSKLKG